MEHSYPGLKVRSFVHEGLPPHPELRIAHVLELRQDRSYGGSPECSGLGPHAPKLAQRDPKLRRHRKHVLMVCAGAHIGTGIGIIGCEAQPAVGLWPGRRVVGVVLFYLGSASAGTGTGAGAWLLPWLGYRCPDPCPVNVPSVAEVCVLLVKV
jgi:hypothetical protein